MNGYDDQALHAIKCYHAKHGNYPQFVEATAEHMEKIECRTFEFIEPLPDTRSEQCTRVPVVEVGAGDIVFRHLVIRKTNIGQQQAECATAEEFQRVGAKFARAGCLIVEPKESGGCVTYNPHLFFSQIEVWVFGEENAFDEAMQEKFNHSSED